MKPKPSVERPMIALRHEESDAIIDGVLSPGELDRFYAWLDQWDKFLFREADFVVADKKAGSLLMRYRVQGRNMRVWVFSDTTDAQVDFMVNPDFIDIEDMAETAHDIANYDGVTGAMSHVAKVTIARNWKYGSHFAHVLGMN